MTTYRQISSPQLYELCRALGLAESAREYLAVQSFLMEPWSDRDVPQLAPYPSRIGDDHSPYEYSVQFARDSVELRLLFEAQAAVPGLRANQNAAELLNMRIAERFGVDFSRFAKLRDLFCPPDPHGPFSLWHAACFDATGQPDFKIYLNPQVHDGMSGQASIAEAVKRLDLAGVVLPIVDRVVAMGGVPNYFSVDLAARLGSRVKVYFSHANATFDDLERALALAPTNQRGDVTRFCHAILGRPTKLDRKPVCYCFSFAAGTNTPLAVTFHLPVAHYMKSDAEILNNVSPFMADEGLPVAEYERAVSALARRDLANSVGLQSYVSFRRERQGLKLTVYLSPELFAAPYAQFPFPAGAGLVETLPAEYADSHSRIRAPRERRVGVLK
jgi:DMATS type aromatic prenyltransferase